MGLEGEDRLELLEKGFKLGIKWVFSNLLRATKFSVSRFIFNNLYLQYIIKDTIIYC